MVGRGLWPQTPAASPDGPRAGPRSLPLTWQLLSLHLQRFHCQLEAVPGCLLAYESLVSPTVSRDPTNWRTCPSVQVSSSWQVTVLEPPLFTGPLRPQPSCMSQGFVTPPTRCAGLRPCRWSDAGRQRPDRARRPVLCSEGISADTLSSMSLGDIIRLCPQRTPPSPFPSCSQSGAPDQ